MDSLIEPLTYREATAVEIIQEPAFPSLMEEYAAESAVDGLPPPHIKIELYARMDGLGFYHGFKALKDGAMIGFICVIVSPLPHYAANPPAVCESFFVGNEHRKGGAGLKLLALAEDRALALGCPGLLVCTPIAGRLFEVLPRRGYTETNRVFFKRVGP